jgi:hypothetical protein
LFPAPDPVLRARILRTPHHAQRFTTPRHTNVTAGKHLTERALRDLPSQLRFERGTPDDVRAGQVNPEFVEFLMGYPINWTQT